MEDTETPTQKSRFSIPQSETLKSHTGAFIFSSYVSHLVVSLNLSEVPQILNSVGIVEVEFGQSLELQIEKFSSWTETEVNSVTDE